MTAHHKTARDKNSTRIVTLMSIRKSFSVALLRAMRVAGVGRDELAECVHVVDKTARGWMSGKQPINFEKLRACEKIWKPFKKILCDENPGGR